MTLEEYYKKHSSKAILELTEKLKQYWENDEEFLLGVLNDLKTDEEREQVIQYINYGEDVSYESIILYTLDIAQLRKQ